MENISLIDVSMEDDLLIADDDDTLSDLPSLENHEPRKVSFLLESTNTHEGWNPGKMNKQLEQTSKLSESLELKRAKSGVVNLRKSLAWDSAFFTSEGVLNTEELAIVNGTFRKAQSCTLPGIQEELRKSSESTSTLDSESYALENLEVDLFGNIRASIQMSHGKCDKAFGVPDALHPSSVKKIDLSNKMKPPVDLKRDGTCKQQLHSTPKQVIIGVNSAVKGIVDSKASSRPPRILPIMSTVPNCKVAAGSIRLKDHTKKLSSGIGVNNRQSFVAFDGTQGNSSSVASRTNASAKPTRGSQPGTVVFSNTCCSSGKSPLELTRKRSASRNGDNSLSASTNKTPLRNSKSRLAPPNAKSTRGSSLRLSPHSSIDSSVSESSSSLESLDASSTSSSHSLAVPCDVDSSQALDMHLSTVDQACVRKGASGTLSESQKHIIKASVGHHALPEPLTRDHSRSINNNTGSKSCKPSGLRMPSPKIGYFDAEKTLDRSSKKFPQTSLRNSLVKSTTTGANKLKSSSKIPSIKPAAHSTSLSPPAPSTTHQDSKPAELHRENDRNPGSVSEGVAEVMLPASLAATHSENRSAVLGVHSDATYQISKLDAQDGRRIENIHLVTNKCEKENLFPAYETNGAASQHLSTENQKMLMIEKKLSSL